MKTRQSLLEFLFPTQDHNGRIRGAELDALIRDLYIKNNKVKIACTFLYTAQLTGLSRGVNNKRQPCRSRYTKH